jgi:hypothetical protein
MSNANKPASPVKPEIIQGNHQVHLGLTKREHFAGLALNIVLNKFDPYEYGEFDSSNYEVSVKHAVGIADALLKELER